MIILIIPIDEIWCSLFTLKIRGRGKSDIDKDQREEIEVL